MTLGIWFIHKGDGPHLKQSIKQFRQSVEEPFVAVVEDTFHKLSDPLPNSLYDIHLESGFQRRGNLNGWDCIRGMWAMMLYCAKEAGVDRLYKIDPDTLLMRDFVKEYDSVDLIGVRGHFTYAMGMCYNISVNALSVIHEHLFEHDPMTMCPVPEDRATSAEVASYPTLRTNFIPWGSGIAGAYDHWGDPEQVWKAYKDAAIVTFGNIRPRYPGRMRNMRPPFPKKNSGQMLRQMLRFRMKTGHVPPQ